MLSYASFSSEKEPTPIEQSHLKRRRKTAAEVMRQINFNEAEYLLEPEREPMSPASSSPSHTNQPPSSLKQTDISSHQTNISSSSKSFSQPEPSIPDPSSPPSLPSPLNPPEKDSLKLILSPNSRAA